MWTIPLSEMTPDDVAERIAELDEVMAEVRREANARLAELVGVRRHWEEAYRRKCQQYGVPGFTREGDK